MGGDAQEAARLLVQADLIWNANEVKAAINRLAYDISKRASERFPVVLVLMSGGVFLAGQLLPKLTFPLEFDYIHATRYGAEVSGGEVAWRVAPSGAVRGRHVLVLDDILDGGQTMFNVRERILEMGAESFESAVLVEKELSIPRQIKADYVGLSVPDRFVFGCGMDAYGYWRNLPEIYAMRSA